MADKKLDINMKYVNKVYKYMKNDSSIEDFMEKFHVNFNELKGILELCRMYGKNVDVVEKHGTLVFKKSLPKSIISKKPDLNQKDLICTEVLVVSDTHFGNIHQQLHLLNKVYLEAWKRDIKLVLHCGDLVDGTYPNRPENPRQQFLHGFDEQVSYVVDMYPKLKGVTTKYILGSHDETHYKNDQATVSEWVSRCRKDMEFLGQDHAAIDLNGVKVFMDHPGGGSAQSVSYKIQKRIEILEPDFKPKIMLIGHYHKSYSFVYRNVRGIEIPCFCGKTQFQQKQGLSNIVGAYFLTIYSGKKGNIQYFEPEEVLFTPDELWDEVGKDKHRVKQLIRK